MTMADETKKKAQKQTGFRLPEELIERIDAHVKRMQITNPGLEATRSDAARVLLTAALDRAEESAAKATKKPKK
jgi:Arc/MetJ-type ribon-helix-helix transcriptional regulator